MDEKKYVLWLAEVGKEQNDLVGKKCANLGEMTKIGMPVPPGYALSVEVYQRFMEETNALEEIRQYLKQMGERIGSIEGQQKAERVLRPLVETKEIPRDVKDKVLSYYNRMCREHGGGSEVAVAVRSAGPASHPGQYETFLNVEGEADLVASILKVWSSTFNQRSIAARFQRSLPLETDPIGVAVLKMVNARSAGVGFTVHPTTGDTSKIVIEGSWGLGEIVVSGAITPDRYILSKDTLEIEDRAIACKTKQFLYHERGIREENVAPEQQRMPCLADEEVKRIAQLGKDLEAHFSSPQDMEWAVDRSLPFPESVFLLQTRPVKTKIEKKSATDQILDLMSRRLTKR